MCTHMHIHTQCSGHSASTSLRDPGVILFRQAKDTRALLGREGTAWSLSLLLHRCSAIGSNNPTPDLHQHEGAGCPSARLTPRAAGGTFVAVGAQLQRWVPSCSGGHPVPGLPFPPPGSLPCLSSAQDALTNGPFHFSAARGATPEES